jgi:hypothetical protein
MEVRKDLFAIFGAAAGQTRGEGEEAESSRRFANHGVPANHGAKCYRESDVHGIS